MFELVLLKDVIRVDPSNFGQNRLDALMLEIDLKYCNKVLENVGLCVCFWEFEKVGDAQVFPGRGDAFTEVHFRFVVFRPFLNEVIEGKVLSMSQHGLKVSLEFFENVFVPGYKLQEPSRFDASMGTWIWSPESPEDDASGEAAADEPDVPFDIQRGDKVRLKVESVRFTRTMQHPNGTTMQTTETGNAAYGDQDSQASGRRQRSSSVDIAADAHDPARSELMPAMEVMGSMNEYGLGNVTWWTGEGEGEGEGEGQDEGGDEGAGAQADMDTR